MPMLMWYIIPHFFVSAMDVPTALARISIRYNAKGIFFRPFFCRIYALIYNFALCRIIFWLWYILHFILELGIFFLKVLLIFFIQNGITKKNWTCFYSFQKWNWMQFWVVSHFTVFMPKPRLHQTKMSVSETRFCLYILTTQI